MDKPKAVETSEPPPKAAAVSSNSSTLYPPLKHKMLPIPKSNAKGFNFNKSDFAIMKGIIDGKYGIVKSANNTMI